MIRATFAPGCLRVCIHDLVASACLDYACTHAPTSKCPYREALRSPVSPRMSRASKSVPARRNRERTTSISPLLAAKFKSTPPASLSTGMPVRKDAKDCERSRKISTTSTNPSSLLAVFCLRLTPALRARKRLGFTQRVSSVVESARVSFVHFPVSCWRRPQFHAHHACKRTPRRCGYVRDFEQVRTLCSRNGVSPKAKRWKRSPGVQDQCTPGAAAMPPTLQDEAHQKNSRKIKRLRDASCMRKRETKQVGGEREGDERTANRFRISFKYVYLRSYGLAPVTPLADMPVPLEKTHV